MKILVETSTEYKDFGQTHFGKHFSQTQFGKQRPWSKPPCKIKTLVETSLENKVLVETGLENKVSTMSLVKTSWKLKGLLILSLKNKDIDKSQFGK